MVLSTSYSFPTEFIVLPVVAYMFPLTTPCRSPIIGLLPLLFPSIWLWMFSWLLLLAWIWLFTWFFPSIWLWLSTCICPSTWHWLFLGSDSLSCGLVAVYKEYSTKFLDTPCSTFLHLLCSIWPLFPGVVESSFVDVFHRLVAIVTLYIYKVLCVPYSSMFKESAL